MKPRIYTEEEHAFMEEFVPGHSYKEIREEFLKRFGGEVTKSFPGSYIMNHGLNTGRNGWFEKGHVPAAHSAQHRSDRDREIIGRRVHLGESGRSEIR